MYSPAKEFYSRDGADHQKKTIKMFGRLDMLKRQSSLSYRLF